MGNGSIKGGDYIIYKPSPRSFKIAQVLTIDTRNNGFRMFVNDEITIEDVNLYSGNGLTRVMDYKGSNYWYPSKNMMECFKRITKKDFNALVKSYKAYMNTLTKADEAFKMVYDSVE